MKLFTLSLIVGVLAATSSFAKITLYSNSDAIQQIISSPKFAELEASYGQISELTVKQRDDSNALQAFEFHLTLSAKTPVGVRSCFIKAHVFVVRDMSAPLGIDASKILPPNFGEVICQK